MAATLLELFEGRDETIAGKLSATIPYAVIGAADEAEVSATALASIPVSYNGIPRASVTMSERVNATTWKVVARYERQEAGGSGGGDTATLENTFAFDTGGGTQNVKQGWNLATQYSETENHPVESAINFDGESVNGVDITIPQYQWSETFWFSPDLVTETYKQTLAYLTGKVNIASFRGYAAGEVLFLGASGTRQGNSYWQITFKFAMQPNQTSISIGGGDIVVATKKGWQYLWVRYEDGIAGTGVNKALFKKARFAYVEDVYMQTTFDGIGIGS